MSNYPTNIPLPNKDQLFDGSTTVEIYKQIGLSHRDMIIDWTDLKSDGDILDVGSGIGRMAIPLTETISKEGSYRGFDVNKMGVKWCQENITPRFPNFQFQHADIYNKLYNSGGKINPSEFQFPYEDDSFDVVILTSVFTHMLPIDLKRYLGEIKRVLREGGTCMITYFLDNDETRELMKENLNHIKFYHKVNEIYSVHNRNIPEAAILYNEGWIRDLYKELDLEIQEPIRFGNWSGRKNCRSGQDTIIAKK